MINSKFLLQIESKGELKQIFNESDLEAHIKDIFEFGFDVDNIVGLFYVITNVLYNNGITLYMEVDSKHFPTQATELSILLERFNSLVAFANDQGIQTCQFQFFEQGYEYELNFNKINDSRYSLEFIDKVPPSTILNVEGELLNLNLMFFMLYSKVTFLVGNLCPRMSTSSVYIEWKAEINELFGVNL